MSKQKRIRAWHVLKIKGRLNNRDWKGRYIEAAKPGRIRLLWVPEVLQ